FLHCCAPPTSDLHELADKVIVSRFGNDQGTDATQVPPARGLEPTDSTLIDEDQHVLAQTGDNGAVPPLSSGVEFNTSSFLIKSGAFSRRSRWPRTAGPARPPAPAGRSTCARSRCSPPGCSAARRPAAWAARK